MYKENVALGGGNVAIPGFVAVGPWTANCKRGR